MARIPLSDVLVALRQELLTAQEKAREEKLKFNVETIEVEAQVSITKETTGTLAGKFGFWLFSEAEVGVERSRANETVQTIRLTLKPDPDDNGPVQVNQQGQKPE